MNREEVSTTQLWSQAIATTVTTASLVSVADLAVTAQGTNSPAVSFRLYNENAQRAPAALPVTIFTAVATFLVFLGCVFLGVSGIAYWKRSSRQAGDDMQSLDGEETGSDEDLEDGCVEE